jgi:hypothetical protein
LVFLLTFCLGYYCWNPSKGTKASSSNTSGKEDRTPFSLIKRYVKFCLTVVHNLILIVDAAAKPLPAKSPAAHSEKEGEFVSKKTAEELEKQPEKGMYF